MLIQKLHEAIKYGAKMPKRAKKQSDEYKACRSCHEEWPADLEFFYGGVRTKDGLMGDCKACFNDIHRPARASPVRGSLSLDLQNFLSRLVQKPEHQEIAQ